MRVIMHSKLKVINSFEEKKSEWEEREKTLPPLKGLKKLPKMPGVTRDTARFLRLKSLYYLIREDEKSLLPRFIFKKPLKHGFSLLKSYLKKKPYVLDGDFFYIGLKNKAEFEKEIQAPDTLFYLGFSYCHKPFECPSGRFTDQCIRDPKNPICGKCFIGKCANLSKNTELLFIPTVHYIGEQMMLAVKENPGKKIRFLITACEMSLKMFADWGNMIGIKGIGVRLDGRICNTMRAFVLSERGIKPGLTVILDETQKQMLELISKRYDIS